MTEREARPELGSMLRTAREARGWSVDHVQVALGFFTTRDGKPKVLTRTQLNRIEAGERNLTTEEAWRFVEIYPELDALGLLLAANAIDEDASPEFRAMIEAEAARRREAYRQGGNRRRSERAMRVVHGKGRKDRQIPLYPEVRAAIIRMLADRGMPRVGPLVVSRGVLPGRPMTPNSVSRALSEHIRKQCGIDGSGHGLRHTFAQTLIAEAGEDKLLTVSRLLGHADTSVTDRVYLRGWQGEPERVMGKLPFPTRGKVRQP